MTDLAPHLTTFLQEHLPRERNFSRHTIQSYTECFKLLVLHAAEQLNVRPCALMVEHFTVPFLLAFLESLEKHRNNSVGTRNIRLAAIKLKLPRFGGHLNIAQRRCPDVEETTAVRAGVPAPDGRAGAGGPHGEGAGTRV